MNANYNNIDNYLRELLSKDELSEFEINLAKDIKLQREVEFTKSIVNYFKYKKVLDAIELAKYANKKNLPEDFEEDYHQVKRNIQQAKIRNIKQRRKKIIRTCLSTCLLYTSPSPRDS